MELVSQRKPGFYFFPQGKNQEFAWQSAITFLRETDAAELGAKAPLFCYGRKFSARSLHRLTQDLFSAESSVVFGARILDWKNFIRGLARSASLFKGRGFKELVLPAQREYFRVVLEQLEAGGLLPGLKGLWREEKFFRQLLKEVNEFRLAGFCSTEEMERLRGSLPESFRVPVDDLLMILQAYEQALGSEEERRHDEASILLLAKEAPELPESIFIYGLEHLCLLEIELLQEMAKHVAIYFPIDASEKEIDGILKSKELPSERSALQLLRLLNTNYAGNREILSAVSESSPAEKKVKIPFLLAHTPHEEARSAAIFIRSVNEIERKLWRVLVPQDYFSSPLRWRAFTSALVEGESVKEENFSSSLAEKRVVQLLFSALELPAKDFPFAATLDFLSILRLGSHSNSFGSIAALAGTLGVRGGMRDWQEKAELSETEEMKRFASCLRNLANAFPTKGAAIDFHQKLLALFESWGVGIFALESTTLLAEQEAHRILAAVIRNSALLAASVEGSFEYQDWIRELKTLLAQTRLEFLGKELNSIEIYPFGSVMPPFKEGEAVLVLGLQKGIEPKRGFSYFLKEQHRRKLQNWNLASCVLEEQDFISYFESLERLNSIGTIRLFLSCSEFTDKGKESAASWITSLFPVSKEYWPGTSFAIPQAHSLRPGRNFHWEGPKVESFSPSLLEAYLNCPFKALFSRLWKVEDGAASPELDIPIIDEGQLYHKALEYYFTKYKGRWITEPDARARAIREALDESVSEFRPKHYKGSEALFAVQLHHWRQKLLRFVEAEAEYYTKFSNWGDPLCEVEFEGLLAGRFPYRGKIDRVDVDEKNRKFAVVDYKRGSTPKTKDVLEGKNFQIPFYLAAAEKKTAFSPLGAYFLSLHSGERNQGLVRKEENKEYFGLHSRAGSLVTDEVFYDVRANAGKRAAEIAEKISHGEFSVAPEDPDNCKRCEFRPVCRIREEAGLQYADAPEKRGSAAKFEALWKSDFDQGAESELHGSKKPSEEQEAALNAGGQLVFVEASAGTGKTTVLVEKMVRTIDAWISEGKSFHEAVEGLAAISFTEKSAAELSERFSQIILQKYGATRAAQATHCVSTIHGFCKKVLTDFPLEAGVDPLADILNELETENLLADALEEFFLFPDAHCKDSLNILFEHYTRASLAAIFISWMRRRSLLEKDISCLERFFQTGAELSPEYIFDSADKQELAAFVLLFQEVCKRFDALKKRRVALDFNDLERLALKALRDKRVSEYYRCELKLLLVDEFQDTNSVQREILDLAALPEGRNIFAVGDAKQSIYRFRAADVAVFQKLRKEAEKKNSLFSLTVNRRSLEPIVDFANLLSKGMFPSSESAPEYEANFRAAKPAKGSGQAVQILEYRAEVDEGKRATSSDFKAKEAKELVRLIRSLQSKKRKLEDIAILFRKISGNQVYFQALREAGIPFQLGASDGFYREQCVIDGIALLRALSEEQNHLALISVLRSPWFSCGEEELAKLFSLRKAPIWQDLPKERFSALMGWKERLKEISAAELLAEAYEIHPAYSCQRERLQIAKLLEIVREFENSGMGCYELSERLGVISGWQREEDAVREDLVSEPDSEGVLRILTVHGAKGLQFPVTILPELDSSAYHESSLLRFEPGLGIAIKDEEKKHPAFDALGAANQVREAAESKRLLYVALTRAEDELYLFLRKQEDGKEKEEQKFTWGDWIRKAMKEGGDCFQKIPLEETNELKESAKPPSIVATALHSLPPMLFQAPLSETSVTELASFTFCPEFHRRKFVQSWDDSVVELWEKPKDSYKRFKRMDGENSAVKKLLKEANMEKKERGIALHRVLERIDTLQSGEEVWRLWLEEAYSAQGVSLQLPAAQELLRMDLVLLRRFLDSPLGEKLFAPGVKAYAELPFLWQHSGAVVHGTVDRIVQISEGEWIVADYKSSSLEGSKERYRFQVSAYVAALHAFLEKQGIRNGRIHAYLIDLYETKFEEVSVTAADAKHLLEGEIEKVRKNYENLPRVPGSERCFSCPYSLHCDAGKKIVLTS